MTGSRREVGVEDASHGTLTDRIPAVGKHAAHLSQPPAHHLNQRAARVRTIDERAAGESPILPDWNPFANRRHRLPDAFAPILSFLVMVALFTAAGTCVLLLRSAHRHAVSNSQPAAAPVNNTAATPSAPTAVGPLGPTASRLVPDEPSETTNIAVPEPAPPKLAATTNEGAGRGAAGNSSTGSEQPPVAAPADQDYPATKYPEYPEPEFPATNDIQLPQANATGGKLPVARFSGQILEAPTRQAKNDDQSILH